jgi:hypothetical protein
MNFIHHLTDLFKTRDIQRLDGVHRNLMMFFSGSEESL